MKYTNVGAPDVLSFPINFFFFQQEIASAGLEWGPISEQKKPAAGNMPRS